MRLFFALWPDAATRERLDRWALELHGTCGGRRMRSENLHVTLAFLGDVEDARVAEVESAAASVAAREFTLVLDETGYFKRNQIVWAGASAPPPLLETLARELRAALERSGIKYDAKPYVSHVTLLRDARAPGTMPRLEPIHWPVRGFALMRSVTSPKGSHYEARRSWGDA